MQHKKPGQKGHWGANADIANVSLSISHVFQCSNLQTSAKCLGHQPKEKVLPLSLSFLDLSHDHGNIHHRSSPSMFF